MPRRSAERRGRPQADVRGNANHSWRSPYRPRTRMRSSEVPVRILPFAPFGAPPPLIFLEATVACSGLARLGRKKTRRENSEARPVPLTLETFARIGKRDSAGAF